MNEAVEVATVTAMDRQDRLRGRTETRWQELIAEVGRHRDLLADTFMQQIQDGRLYYESRVGAEELRITANAAFELLLKELAGVPKTQEEHDFPRRVGVRRARQGVESDKLTAAVHRDFSALWTCLLTLAVEDDALVLAAHAEDVWRVVDVFAGKIHTAYVEEVVAIAQERSMSRQSVVAQLLTDVNPSAMFLQRAGQVLSIRDTDGLWVAACTTAEDESLRRFAETMRRSGRVAYSHGMDGRTIALWVSVGDRRELIDLGHGWEFSTDAKELREVHCGIAPMTRGLAGLRDATGIATEVAMAMAPGHRGPATMSDVWPIIAGASLHKRMPGFHAALLSALYECKEAERTVLIETVRVYAANGDIAVSANQLFCHRNTVMKRLRRFRELTGLDMAVPDQAAQAIVALAHQQLD